MSEAVLDPLLGAVVAGRYHVERRLAAGGMGVVYIARQEPLGRRVALKVIRGDASDPVAQQRFEREARAASSLQDPHVVVVHDFGVIEHVSMGRNPMKACDSNIENAFDFVSQDLRRSGRFFGDRDVRCSRRHHGDRATPSQRGGLADEHR